MLRNFISRFTRRRDMVTVQPKQISLLFPLGHFYSPVADPEDLLARLGSIWKDTDVLPGIDMRVSAQLELLRQLSPYISQITYPLEQPPDDPTVYFYRNDQYPRLDAEFLFTFLCRHKPRHMIEIGSGFSSLVTADVNCRMLDRGLDFTCIEPYPRQFLINGVEGITRLVREKVENVAVSFFDRLEAGDVLFIDSSHITKTGSDVNYLFFEVLPRLKKGVFVHLHDSFLPFEYPRKWVIDEGRNWNEQYLLRAFMQFNSEWQVVWMAHYMGVKHKQAVQAVFPYFSDGPGGSFWIQRL